MPTSGRLTRPALEGIRARCGCPRLAPAPGSRLFLGMCTRTGRSVSGSVSTNHWRTGRASARLWQPRRAYARGVASSSESKLDAPTRQYLAELDEQPQRRMSVIVRGTRAFTDEVLGLLEEAGVHILTVAGDILTADLAPERLGDVLDNDDVAQVSISGPLYDDSTGSASPGFSDAE